ncbi:MAG: YncE family protein [Thermoplasmata archaeon]|nr:YncE family protein [Thermoplasmata archaeon]
MKFRRILFAWVAVALCLTASVAVTASASGSHAGATVRVSTLSTSGSRSEPVLPRAAAPGSTISTLTLFNNTIRAGNFFPDPTRNPVAVAYDTKNGTVWFTATGVVGIANASTGVGERYLTIRYEPWGLAYDNRSDRMFVTQFTSSTASSNVSVFNASTYQLLGNVSVGINPDAVAYDWQTDQVYVAAHSGSPGYENVTVINASTLQVLATLHAGSESTGVEFAPSEHEVLVANHGSDNLTVIDPATLSVVGSVNFVAGGTPQSLAYDPQDHLVYVTGVSPGVVGVNLTRGVVVVNITVGTSTDGIAVDPASSTLYVSDLSAAVVWYLQTVGGVVVGSVNLGTYAFPDGVAYDPGAQLVLVPCEDAFYYAGSNITEISARTNSTVRSIGIEYLPGTEVYSAAHHAIYLYDGGTGRVEEINDTTDHLVRSVFVGYTPHTIGYVSGGLALDTLSNGLYVDFANGLVAGLDFIDLATFTVTRSLPGTAFGSPAGIVFDPADNRTFVANVNNNTVTVLDAATNTVLGWTTVGARPISGVLDPVTDEVYFADEYANYVSVLDGATGAFVTNVGVGSGPLSLAYDSANHEVYVANAGGSNLTAINGMLRTSVANISVNAGGYPDWVAYNPTNNTIEVAASAGGAFEPGELAIVNGSNQSFAGSIYVGTAPGDVVYDPAVGETFVSDYSPGSLSIVTLGTSPSGPPLLVTSLQAEPATISLGATSNLVTSTSGGSPPLSYAYSTLPSGCSSQNLASLPCTPSSAGTFHVGVNVTDSASGHGAGAALLTVLAPSGSFQVGLTASPSSISLGQTTTLTATPAGGVGPYSYTYQGLPTGCVSANSSSLACDPSVTGGFTVDVVVVEANGTSATNSTSLTVTAAAGFQVTLVADPSAVAVNQTSDLVVTPIGGSSPFSYVYTQLPGGCVSANTARLACVPTQAGTFHPHVTVTEGTLQMASATTTLNVTSSGGNSQPSGNSSFLTSDWWILIILGVAALLLIFFFFARRRKKDDAPAQDSTPMAPPGPAGVPPPPPPQG